MKTPISITRNANTGALTLAAVVAGYRCAKTYFGYTVKAAKADFRQRFCI